jgi:branched-chain amino acid aminotransferase
MVWLGDGNSGGLVPSQEALVSVFDHGLTVGDGVFETLKVTPAGVFARDRHLNRLARSSQSMGLDMPNAGLLEAAIDEVLLANAEVIGNLGRMRITVTGGSGPLGSERSKQEINVVVAVGAQAPWPTTATLKTVPWPRNEHGALTSVKSTSYAENVVALRYAHQHGGDEGVFLNTSGFVCEGTGSNIFWIKDDIVYTPSLKSGALAGITRELVLLWQEVKEVDLPLPEVLNADEIFITSSTRDVQPVVAWDDRNWPGIGAVTTRIQQTFTVKAQQNSNP